MTRPTFPRIGSDSTVFDAVTVTFRDNHYSATARRDGIRGSARESYRYDGTPNSQQAVDVAWSARLVMSERFREEGHRREVGDIADRTAAEWSDPNRYAVVVSVEVPGAAYVVTFIPRELASLIAGRAKC